jgi:hypothetical protein
MRYSSEMSLDDLKPALFIATLGVGSGLLSWLIPGPNVALGPIEFPLILAGAWFAFVIGAGVWRLINPSMAAVIVAAIRTEPLLAADNGIAESALDDMRRIDSRAQLTKIDDFSGNPYVGTQSDALACHEEDGQYSCQIGYNALANVLTEVGISDCE